jgi:hypothetical protein
MKLFAKLLLASLVIALLLPFTVLKNDQGKPLMSFSSFSLPNFSMPDLSGMTSSAQLTSSSGGTVNFYKWYDAEGNVQFTTEPPPDGIEYQVKGFDPNANVIQSVKLPEVETEEMATPVASETGGAKPGLANPYDADTIKKLFADTENIEKLLSERFENQNSTLNQ